MEYFDEINSLQYLFLVKIEDLPANSLCITVKEATIGTVDEYVNIGAKKIGPVRNISSEGPGNIYEIYFRSYGAYSVTNESFALYNDSNERIGRLLCVFSRSNYLDYIRTTTLVDHIYVHDGDVLTHYALNCQHHVIDIVTVDTPTITRH